MDEKQFYIGVLQLIDISSKRGCWEGSELGAVSQIRNEVVEKLKSFNEEVQENTSELNNEDVG
jgi:gas vesicle protein